MVCEWLLNYCNDFFRITMLNSINFIKKMFNEFYLISWLYGTIIHH